LNAEPFNLSPQIGSWEILQENSDSGEKFARQTVTVQPVNWCGSPQPYPIAFIGSSNW